MALRALLQPGAVQPCGNRMPAIAPLILLAEDDRYIRETTSDLLALSGIRVVGAD
jgi:hypothetical protein